MKITIEGDAKEIAALLGTERLDSKLADVKKEIIGEISDAIAKSIQVEDRNSDNFGELKQQRPAAFKNVDIRIKNILGEVL